LQIPVGFVDEQSGGFHINRRLCAFITGLRIRCERRDVTLILHDDLSDAVGAKRQTALGVNVNTVIYDLDLDELRAGEIHGAAIHRRQNIDMGRDTVVVSHDLLNVVVVRGRNAGDNSVVASLMTTIC
jgi:hypothetical protein